METETQTDTHPAAGGHPVVVFDGVCNLCNWAVNFIIDRDPAGHFRFVAGQAPEGQALLGPLGAADLAASTIVLVEPDGRLYSRSTAALRIARRLRWPWSLLYAWVVVPRPLRDPVYRLVAQHRYRLFGKRDVCRVPTPELRARFL
jgi:predicted DCC family thiol-disulfide oxidoreductase YuxK